MTVLILYTELAEYTLSCISALSQVNQTEIHVVKWPVKNEAPFKFRNLDSVKFYNREELDADYLLRLAKSINPSVIVVSGWVDKSYLQVCKALKKTAKTVLTLDNKWKGDLKQTAKTILAKRYFKSIFSHAWVPGEPQKVFAKKLGFSEDRIRTGFYSADVSLFRPLPNKTLSYNLIYVGRYLEFKGIFDLWNAFKTFRAQSKHPWTLHCVGTGDLWEKRMEHPHIIHHGFLQPTELKKLVDTCDVFILPSHKEPWGVVVHEMASSGLTLLCSDQIGAATAFIEEGKNGYTFKSADEKSLCNALKTIDLQSEEEFLLQSEKSQSLAQSITPETWAETLLNIANE